MSPLLEGRVIYLRKRQVINMLSFVVFFGGPRTITSSLAMWCEE
jgi:hypothetical protein